MEVSRKVLLSTAYFPNIQYFTKIISYSEIYLEFHENYTKQTYRNRCNILSANKILPLVVPVKKRSGSKTPVSEAEIDNNYRWQRLHRISIESAYRSSPFFEYYYDDFTPVFRKRYKYLFDLNMEILKALLDICDIGKNIEKTGQYLKNPENADDYRDIIHPKKRFGEIDPDFTPAGYVQVFSDRRGFAPNLSILDLLFNEGPGTKEILRLSCKGGGN